VLRDEAGASGCDQLLDRAQLAFKRKKDMRLGL
jgi:hypothetical protein